MILFIIKYKYYLLEINFLFAPILIINARNKPFCLLFVKMKRHPYGIFNLNVQKTLLDTI